MPLVVVQAIVTGLVWLCVLGLLLRRVGDPAEVGVWARRHGVELTGANLAIATYFVNLQIVLRVLGGCGGLLITRQLGGAFAPDTSIGSLPWVGALGGWMLGAWWADRRIGAPARRRPAATLTPRRLADYLPTPLRWAPVAAAGLAVVAAGVVVATAPDASRRWVVGEATAAAVVIVALAALAQRAVVARPQPAMDPARVDADDAARSSTIHHLGGGATAAALALAGAIAQAPPTPSSGLVVAAALVAPLAAWRLLAFRRWQVRRGPSSARVLAR